MYKKQMKANKFIKLGNFGISEYFKEIKTCLRCAAGGHYVSEWGTYSSFINS